MFQDFSAPKDKISGDSRLSALREEMNKLQLDAIIVPHADEQRNEYLPPCNERLAWISGFTGSAGAAIVTRDTAILFVDGRYTLQASEQTDGDHWQTASLIDTPPHVWLAKNAQKNWQIGIDPWLHTKNEVSNLEQACENFSGSLVLIDNNLVDEVWRDRPPMPKEPVQPTSPKKQCRKIFVLLM